MITKPLKFTVEELREVIDNYLDKTPENKWTITGLALKVGSRQLLCDYEKKADYRHIVKQAKLFIEYSYEIDLKKRGNSGTIFALKNFGWKDHQELDMNHNFAGPSKIKFGDNSKKEIEDDEK